MKMLIHKILRKGIIPAMLIPFLGVGEVSAQLVGDNVFLKGNYIEVGIAKNQQFGSHGAAPTGYHPRGWSSYPANSLGFVADPALDGWTAGYPNYIGCYFLPGYPQEGWDMSINGVWIRGYAGDWGYLPPGFIVTGGTMTTSGSNTDYYIEGPKKYGVWEGYFGDLAIKSVTSFDTTKVFFTVQVNLKNEGSTTLSNLYYSRTLDPDNESVVPGGGNPTTVNVIEYQPDLDEGDYRALVSATGLAFPSLSYLGIGAFDCRAKVYIYPGGLNPSVGPHNIGSDAFFKTKDYTNTADCAIGINFELGDLEPGDSTTFTYSYILSSDDLDTAFGSLATGWYIDGNIYNFTGDTFKYMVCRNEADSLNVSLNGGSAFVWGEWVASSGPNYPAGLSNRIAMPPGETTYRLIGTSPVCPIADTLYLTIIPVGDTTVLYQQICEGSVFDFDGTIIYKSGIYYKTYKTPMYCDSVTELHLTVNPLPNTEIKVDNTAICEGDNALFQVADPSSYASYTWLHNGTPIPGATGPNYVATQPGVYRVAAVTDKGCADTSRGVTLSINPGAEVSILDMNLSDICVGDTLEFRAEEKPGYEYYWSPEKSFRYTSGARTPVAQGVMLEEVNVVNVMAINEYGCRAEDQIIVPAVPCCDVYLPTAFSPNGDGVNDYFNIILQPGQRVVSFQIFDRTGKMVYDNNDIINGWNGRILNTGDEVAQSVYYYRIVYSCTDGRNYEAKGDITVVR